MARDGSIVDNPSVGPTLTEAMWRPGNSVSFLTLVERLTGKALAGDAWVSELKQDLSHVIESEKAAYEAAGAEATGGDGDGDGDGGAGSCEEIDLDMRIR